MRHLFRGIVVSVLLGLVGMGVALVSVALPFPQMPPEADVFGFAAKADKSPPHLPPLQQFRARDGDALAYRFYDSASERMLIFVHGASYHGGGYDDLARYVSAAGAAKVVLPNMRGHYFSGRRRGDVEYIGQYEDDIVDLIRELHHEGRRGPIILGDHSSGAGFVLRFAGDGGGCEPVGEAQPDQAQLGNRITGAFNLGGIAGADRHPEVAHILRGLAQSGRVNPQEGQCCLVAEEV